MRKKGDGGVAQGAEAFQLSTVKVKVCGLSTPDTVRAAGEGGADFIGLVFFPKSPRHVTVQRAAELASIAKAAGVGVVAVTVDAPSILLDEISAVVAPDLFQLHGSETPAWVAQARNLTATPTMRALRIGEASDLDAAKGFEEVADYLMFDAKAPPGAALPGGNGAAFDWSILSGRTFAKPWFLAGGLNAANVGQAMAQSGASLVDVSSGVESAPGVKDPFLIEAFLKAVRRAEVAGVERRLKS
jgi:phosphoribosylanthranilate isomerase